MTNSQAPPRKPRLPWRPPGKILGCLILVLLLGGCSGEKVGSDAHPQAGRQGEIPAGALAVSCQGQPGGSLRYALAGEPSTFNYLAVSVSRSQLLAVLTTGTLLEFDPVAQTVGPGVCTADFGSDGTSVRLSLRKGLRFSDGVPVSTEDVLFTLEKIFDPASANVLKDSLYIYGEPLQFSLLPSGEVELKWPGPFSGIESVLSTIPVLPRHLLDSGEANTPIEEQWTLGTAPTKMAGLGPFRVAEHQPGVLTVLRRNPYYWKTDSSGVQLPYLDEVRVLYVEDRNAQVLRLTLGQLDLIDQLLRPEDFRLLEDRKTCVTRELGPSSNVTFLCPNLDQPTSEAARIRYSWFSKRDFRRGLSAAVSRSAIVRNVYLGLATEAKRLISPANSRWYLPAKAEQGGVEAALALFRQAGFSYRKTGEANRLVDSSGNPVRFELLTSVGDLQGRIASLIRQDLARVGIEVSVRQEELRALVSRVTGSRDYDVAMMNMDVPLEPFQMGDLLLSDGTSHIWRLDQSEPSPWELEIDRLMEEFSATVDQERRVELFSRVQRLLADEVPLIPLVHRDILLARSPGLSPIDVASVLPYAWARSWKISWAKP